MEKIIVAFEKEKNALHIKELIEAAGLAGVQLCRSGMEVRRLVGRENRSVVVCGYKLSDGSAEALFEDLPPDTCMLMVATQPQLDLCGAEGIFKLPAPIHREELLSGIDMLIHLSQQAERFVPLQRNTAEAGVIQQAKAYLMATYGLDETAAHRLLQKKSMDRGCKLIEMARLILEDRAQQGKERL